jgi:hypothetical protein
VRALFVGGLIAIATGIYGAGHWHTESVMAQLGVIAILTVGLLAAVLGIVGLVWEQTPSTAQRALRQRLVDRAAWRALLAPVVALALMVTYFAVTGWWDVLDNPVASQLSVVFGVIGALAGMAANRITHWLRVIVPVALVVALIVWGDRLPLESPTMSQGEMIALLVIAVLLIGITINIPQLIRGRRVSPEA